MAEARTPRGEKTRARLLAAAKEALVQGGGDMAHADVAERADVSAGASYRYFPSKSSLIVAVVEGFFDELEAVAYVPTFESEAESWWGREQIRIARMVGFFFDDPLGPFIAQGTAADAEVARAMGRRLSKQCRGAASNVALGQSLGVADTTLDPQVAGALLMGGVYQALSVALSDAEPDRNGLIADLTVFMARVLAISED